MSCHCLAPTFCQSFVNIVKHPIPPNVHRIALVPSCIFKRSVHPFANAIQCYGTTIPITPSRVIRCSIPFHHLTITIITRSIPKWPQQHVAIIIYSTIRVANNKYCRQITTMPLQLFHQHQQRPPSSCWPRRRWRQRPWRIMILLNRSSVIINNNNDAMVGYPCLRPVPSKVLYHFIYFAHQPKSFIHFFLCNNKERRRNQNQPCISYYSASVYLYSRKRSAY
jgi:hypothetical protein